MSRIYSAVDETRHLHSIEAAEMVKYADNVWHATKVAFGNEIGRLCKALDIDSHDVMNIFVKDTKLNLSPYYLKPGFAFGGSCLPKEVRAVAHLADRARRRAAADRQPDGHRTTRHIDEAVAPARSRSPASASASSASPSSRTPTTCARARRSS